MRSGAAARIGAAIVVMAGCAALAPAGARAQQPERAPAAARSLIERALDSRARGGTDAPVVVFEVADFQCPHCARFAATVGRELDRRYVETGRVQWVFVTLPLNTHHAAWIAAKAALCTGATGGRFWDMRDRLYAEQPRWTRNDDPAPLFARYAREAGAPDQEYDACMAQDRVAPLILQDFGAAVSAGISGTPTFIVVRGDSVVTRMVGVRSMEEWVEVLDGALRP